MTSPPLPAAARHAPDAPLFAEIADDVAVSFEFFPPKTTKADGVLWDTVRTLAPLGPRFVSVTYGAGGSTRERTHAAVMRIARETGIPQWMGRLFDGLDDRPETRQLVAATVAAEMCGKLYAGGSRHFHFYTLNRAELSYAICHLLGKRPGNGKARDADRGRQPSPGDCSQIRYEKLS